MDVLGDSLEEIASEKAGVIKQGALCVVGPSAWEREAIQARAKDQKVDLIAVPSRGSYT